MARMYTAVLRENWTAAERKCIEESEYARKLLTKVRANVWYPTPLQLFQYLRDRLPEDEKADVEYHLQVDQCKRSQRLAGLLRFWIARFKTAADSLKRLEQSLVAGFLFPACLEPIPVPAGAASRGPSPTERVTTDDGQTSAVYSRQGDELWLSLESASLPSGTLLRIALANPDLGQEQTLFAMLRAEGERATGKARLDRNIPEHCLVFSQPVDAAALPGDDAPALNAAFWAAQGDDPASVQSWVAWAAAARNQPGLEPQVRQTLETIAATAQRSG